MPNAKRCVVLNNQLTVHIDECAARSARKAEARCVLQPDPTRRLHTLKTVVDESRGPVPIFFVEGRFQEKVVAEGLLHEVRFREELSAEEKRVYRSLKPQSDSSLFGRTLIMVSHVERRASLSMRVFRKTSDGKAPTAGSWVASVCELPSRRTLDARSEIDAAEDESVSAVEGEERKRLVGHRLREWKLRESKIAAVLRAKQRLSCEIAGCGFDFTAQYGAIGEMYAHVHHLEPLGERHKPKVTNLKQLAIVCANCHAMIHRHGVFRSMREVASAIRMAKRRHPAL